eukprot:TRINITY_DN1131_c0_g1_i3.p1 TRINITY_DN1131_c0_g1~~TRINITY_DN1131_c0_g1_i3.p1  ORF type:complete len:453 (-),score=154.09 TRINITY_DN1131_c0_g1_i3:89-1447(-)
MAPVKQFRMKLSKSFSSTPGTSGNPLTFPGVGWVRTVAQTNAKAITRPNFMAVIFPVLCGINAEYGETLLTKMTAMKLGLVIAFAFFCATVLTQPTPGNVNGFPDVPGVEEKDLDNFIRNCFTGAMQHQPKLKDDPVCQDFATRHPKANEQVLALLGKPEKPVEGGEEEGKGIEGDLLMPGEKEPGTGVPNGEEIIFQDQGESDQPIRTGKRNIAIPVLRWPKGLIKYRYDPNLPAATRVKAETAIQHWMNNTCLKFELTNSTEVSRGPVSETRKKNHYILIRPSSGCSANVGFTPTSTPQYLNLGDGCGTGNIVHELAHAFGILHTQSRQDRDLFVKIRWENIVPTHTHNFEKSDPHNFKELGDYDFGSIMHYPATAFSKDSSITIQQLKPAPIGTLMGQRVRASPHDVYTVKQMYQCPGVLKGQVWRDDMASGVDHLPVEETPQETAKTQ